MTRPRAAAALLSTFLAAGAQVATAQSGIHQYEPESWHWEAAPSPCA
ncbi:hypothetical protein [Luteococcus sanguinis]|uniref:Uncharacterized protein n=1 Tax=Luteococcus sanguinis TaxID=174038 RepID=A0ABW1WYJ6_9ACTN